MRRRRFLGAAALGLVTTRAGAGAGRLSAQEPVAATGPIDRVLEAIRTGGRRLPGMIGAVVLGEKLEAIGASGVRKVGSPVPIRPGDLVHLGSCTKAMTATMIGTLVDEGKLRWESTVGEVFPEGAGTFHPEFRSATLAHLLAHRAGLPNNARRWNLGAGLSPTDQRRAILAEVLRDPPLTRPGTAHAYSNLGYALAGLMAEQVTRTPWEVLMRRRLFAPLGMASAGFGAPGEGGRIDQPWGHRISGGVIEPSREDNAPAMGPAGTVHCSIADWARFASLHLDGEVGGVRLLKPETLRTLHTPTAGGDYAGGWLVCERSWAGGTALTHSGSNTTWYCTVWLAPARDLALLVATNAGGDEAGTACDEAIKGLLRYHAFTGRGRRR